MNDFDKRWNDAIRAVNAARELVRNTPKYDDTGYITDAYCDARVIAAQAEADYYDMEMERANLAYPCRRA